MWGVASRLNIWKLVTPKHVQGSKVHDQPGALRYPGEATRVRGEGQRVFRV
jgi:hypothetical protein